MATLTIQDDDTISLAPVWVPLVLYNFPFYLEGPGEIEPNNTDEDASANGRLYSGRAYAPFPNDQVDLFYFVSAAEGAILVELTVPDGADHQLYLYKGSTASDYEKHRGGFPYVIADYSGPAGIYYVKVTTGPGSINAATSYSLRITYP
jgi:hypothetical protein